MINSRLAQSLFLLIATVFAVSFGFSYGNVGNQGTYLPHALNYIHPEFLSNDWLVRDTTVYHSSFRWIVVGLAGLGSVAWGVALLHILLVVGSLCTLYLIIATLARGEAHWAMALTTFCMILDRTGTVGASFLFSDGLQPSTLATTAWLVSMWTFLRQQYVLSGCILAIGGLFHTNFLILGIGLFALAHFFLQEKKLATRLFVQLAPSLAIMAFSLPMILAAAGGEGAHQARDIFLLIRSPHHYVPLTHLTEFFYLGGWFLCALGALFAIPDFPLRRSMLALFAAFGISLIGATLLTTFVFVPRVSQLYVWRLAPFMLVISQMTVAIFLVRQLSVGSRQVGHGRLLACVGIIGAAMILRWVLYSTSLSFQFGVTAVLIGSYIALWLVQRKPHAAARRNGATIFGCCALTAAILLAFAKIPSVIERSTLFHDHSNGLHAWAQRTSEKSVFLVPIELGDFRLLAKRPVVVDWKSTPIKPNELIEWYNRINVVAGKSVHSFDEAVAGYRSHDLNDLRRIASGFGADYIVVNNAKQNMMNVEELPVFSNKKFSVFSTQPGMTGNSAAALARKTSE